MSLLDITLNICEETSDVIVGYYIEYLLGTKCAVKCEVIEENTRKFALSSGVFGTYVALENP